MTNEELNRRYHELCGWRFHDYYNGGGHWHSKECAWAKTPHWNIYRDCDKACSRTLPALHLDANLAIAEAEKEFGGGFELELLNDGKWCVSCHATCFVNHVAATPCEAILKALIAAQEQSHG